MSNENPEKQAAKLDTAPPKVPVGTNGKEIKTESKKAEEKAAREKEKENTVTTKQLAAKLGCAPTALRRFLRTLPTYQDKQYTRYGWPVGDKFLATIEQSYAKHVVSEDEKRKVAKEAKAEKAKEAEKKEKAKEAAA